MGDRQRKHILKIQDKRRIRIIARSEPPREYMLIMSRVVCSLRTLGSYYHGTLADFLPVMGFKPCKTEQKIWTIKLDNKEDSQMECMPGHVSDLMIASKLPKVVTDALINKYYFDLKYTRPISFHLG